MANIINELRRKKYNEKIRKRLINKNFSLIASNCNGGCILHDLGVRFNSPFVDVWMYPKDFLKICHDLKRYMEKELVFIKEEGLSYPVGLLDDVKVYFQHYDTENEALEKWNERKKRIDYGNIFFLFTDRDGCGIDELGEFDKLPYENKAVFVHKKYSDIKSAAYIPGFEEKEAVGFCMDYTNFFTYKRYYDEFVFVKWFNQGNEEKLQEK